MYRRFCVILTVLLLGGVSVADDSTELEALLKVDRAFDAKTAELGVEGWVSYFAEQGSMHVSSGATIVGHDAIRELMGPLFADPDFSLRWQPTTAVIMIPGSLGYTTGSFESRSRGEEEEIETQRGTYVTVWKKQDDGSWKVVFDTGENDG